MFNLNPDWLKALLPQPRGLLWNYSSSTLSLFDCQMHGIVPTTALRATCSPHLEMMLLLVLIPIYVVIFYSYFLMMASSHLPRFFVDAPQAKLMWWQHHYSLAPWVIQTPPLRTPLVHPSKLHHFLTIAFVPCVQQTPPFWTKLVHSLKLHRFYVVLCVMHIPPLTTPVVHPFMLHRFFVAPCVVQTPPLLHLLSTSLVAANRHISWSHAWYRLLPTWPGRYTPCGCISF